MAVFQLDDGLCFPNPYLGDEDGLVAVGDTLSVTLRVSLRLQVLDAPSKCSVSWDFLPRLIFFHFYPCFSAINNVKK